MPSCRAESTSRPAQGCSAGRSHWHHAHHEGRELQCLFKTESESFGCFIPQQMGPDAPIDEFDANGCTPLMYAVMSESQQAIEMLLNFGARREQVAKLHTCCTITITFTVLNSG